MKTLSVFLMILLSFGAVAVVTFTYPLVTIFGLMGLIALSCLILMWVIAEEIANG